MAMIKRGTATGRIQDVKEETARYVFCVSCGRGVSTDKAVRDTCPHCKKSISGENNDQHVA